MTQHPIAAFLHARYDMLEEIAREAMPGPWQNAPTARHHATASGRSEEAVFAAPPDTGAMVVAVTGEARERRNLVNAEHIAAHDPAYVLADIAGKRLILEDHRWWWDQPDQPQTDAELHARCLHPDYEYETTEGQRKAWDAANTPPVGPDLEPDHSWERNVDAGIPGEGWERFDYTEESYWRRRRTPEDIEQRRARHDRPPLALRALALPFARHPEYQESWKP